MAFEGLSGKLQDTFKKLRGKGKLTEKDIKEATREIKLALLEADVNFKVVKKFVADINERSMGAEVLKSLTPGQQVIKIVKDEMTRLLGEKPVKLDYASKGLTGLMLVGLQGAGKTTTAGKLANHMKKDGKKVLLVACDVYRPAAVKQLQVVGKQVDAEVYSDETSKDPVQIAKDGFRFAREHFFDVVLYDTAGRLQIDETLMEELAKIKEEVAPDHIVLNIDAMTGQEAVQVAETFNEKIDLTGVILTKLDGDTRGGAALSVSAVTGKPILFAGMGEKLTDLEIFYPDRMASRILGMGDVLSFIEKAQADFDEEKAKEQMDKFRKQTYTLEDFKEQLLQMKSMGSFKDIIDMMPGANKKALKGMDFDDKEFARSEAIINSMTKNERIQPNIINASRRKRIAAGSGTRVQDVNKLLKGFEQSKKMMKQLSGLNNKKHGKMKFPFM
ncbi:signal recognition particle protein [Alkalibacter rhizosphaerae]|uniref:Signal recognition particle protein n=1 Tax=Alkalibacter rhizosphaerae TaxID=2815577 RepID=A0A975AI56_9FIRM|nr:signal recognition particle protein [Alkalibacter rhizosphaerae]QSX08723.1 signal recognition particle protein [Alkalibacter rhizosphaerae]